MVKHKVRQMRHCYEIGTQGMQSVYDIFTRIAFHINIRGGQVGFSSYNNSLLSQNTGKDVPGNTASYTHTSAQDCYSLSAACHL